MEHTKGPWEYFEHNHYKDIRAKGQRVTTFDGKKEDAKLIAAAPEMFEALESSIRHFWRFAEWDRSILLLKNPDHPVFKWESIINKAKSG